MKHNWQSEAQTFYVIWVLLSKLILTFFGLICQTADKSQSGWCEVYCTVYQ